MNGIQTIGPSAAIDSRVVAQMVEKEHKNLLQDIRNYISYLEDDRELKIQPSDFFIESTYFSTQNKEQPCYLITKQGCEMVANKLTGKKGVLFTARYVKKFNEMEAAQPKNSYMIEDPIARAQAWIEEQREKQRLIETTEVQAQLIAEYEPIVSYVDEILSAPGAVTITQIGADYGMAPQEMNKLLNKHGVQHKVGGQWILYRKHMNNGFTKSETISFYRSNGRPDTKMNTKWTQKGRLFIYNTLKDAGVLPSVERKE